MRCDCYADCIGVRGKKPRFGGIFEIVLEILKDHDNVPIANQCPESAQKGERPLKLTSFVIEETPMTMLSRNSYERSLRRRGWTWIEKNLIFFQEAVQLCRSKKWIRNFIGSKKIS